MLLKYFYDQDLAQASYLVACPASGEALVIDPMRNIEPYLRLAQERGLHIIGAAETHIHADYVSGGHELAAAVHGTLYASAYGGDLGYKIAHTDIQVKLLHDGDTIRVGKVQLQAVHLPGHTPEHVGYLVTADGTDQPFGLFSGDCLFVGDIGRPDLLEAAVGVVGSAVSGAKQQFAAVQKLKTLPDYLQVLPGHGAGSACGKALGDLPSTTLGYEKLFNPAFQYSDESAFVDWLLADQPAVPRYFAQMKQVNQRGAELTGNLRWPRPIIYDSEVAIAREHLLIDTRPPQVFAAAHIPNSVNIPANDRQFNTYAGMFVDYARPTYLVVDTADLETVLDRLQAVGIDHIGGYVAAHVAGRYQFFTSLYTAPEAETARLDHNALFLDVRDHAERSSEHIAGSEHIMLGDILKRAGDLPKDREIILHCATGLRSQIAASLLAKHGVHHVANLIGGLDAWKLAGLPVEQG